MIRYTEKFGAWIVDQLAACGDFYRFGWQTLYWFFKSARHWRNWALTLPQAYAIGVKSVGVVAITGGFIGMILAVQIVEQFQSIGMEERLGAIINLSTLRELAPVLAGVMLAGRVGGALTAELATMNITEQIDALRVMGSDPIRYLVVPRVIVCTVLTPLLTMIANFAGVVGGAMIAINVFNVQPKPYWEFSSEAVEAWDLYTPLLKATVFGYMLGVISCYKGFRCSSGAEGVGRACTEAFVSSFIALLAIDFLLNLFLKGCYEMLYGSKTIF